MRVAPMAAVLLLVAAATAPAAGSPGGSVSLTLGASGALNATVAFTDPNGSALRYAMDGNFTPLVDALVTNATQRATILAQIATAESTPIIGAFFGNRDGTVVASEVTLFESLIEQQVQLLPASSLTGGGGVGLVLDGAPPTSAHLDSVSFANATGPVSSSQPILVTSALSYQFTYGSGSHSLALTFNNSSTGLVPAGGEVSVTVSLTTPAATAVTGATGFNTTSVANDLWGLGPAHFSGTYDSSSGHPVSIAFGPAFPTAYVALGAAVAALVLLGALLLWRRRRRARR